MNYQCLIMAKQHIVFQDPHIKAEVGLTILQKFWELQVQLQAFHRICVSMCGNEPHKETVIMTDTVIVALLSLGGTILGSFGGILTSSKLTNYRIEQLEKKVDKHNHFAQRIPVLEEQVKSVATRIENLEDKI